MQARQYELISGQDIRLQRDSMVREMFREVHAGRTVFPCCAEYVGSRNWVDAADDCRLSVAKLCGWKP
jgi:hypothetical protein